MFERFFSKSKLEVISVKHIPEKREEWDGNGVIFYVKNGKGLLCHKYGSYGKKEFSLLTYDKIPLIRFHGDEYYCRTCEKLVSAGYGLDMADESVISEMRSLFNLPFISLKNSFENLKPLLGLLQTGYYALIDTELYPTDGNGNFFWGVNNTPVYNKASCPIYEDDSWWSEEIAKYILPSQSPKSFNRTVAEYYRKNSDYRAIAYYMEGNLCILLDGHHKAVAAALEHRPVKALVIIPASSGWEKSWDLEENRGGISFNGVNLYENEMITSVKKAINLFKLNQISEDETREYLLKVNPDFDNYKWDDDILKCEKYYPDVRTFARIRWAGEITNEKIDKVINNQTEISDVEAVNLVTALHSLNHPRFKEVTFYFCRNEFFISVWKDIFILLSKVKDEEIEDFFIEYLVNSDVERADLKKIINKYLQ